MANTIAPKRSGSAPSPQPSPQGERGTFDLFKAVRSLCSGFASTARLMVGVPDYDSYVRHRREMHPNESVMSYEEFFRERQNSRYGVNGGTISRCC